MIRHFFHAYVGGPWEDIVTLHLASIAPIPDLDLYVGIVGPHAERNRLVRKLPSGTEVIAEKDHGFEQVTLQEIQGHTSPGEIVVYSHTKGGANDHSLNRNWFRHLEQWTFGYWQRARANLGGVDVVAPNWLTESVTGVLPPGCAGFSPGNYWWATSDYLLSLPAPHDPGNRYAAEEWIGLGDPRVMTIDPQPWDWRKFL